MAGSRIPECRHHNGYEFYQKVSSFELAPDGTGTTHIRANGVEPMVALNGTSLWRSATAGGVDHSDTEREDPDCPPVLPKQLRPTQITSEMKLDYIVTCLVWHGCHDMTDSMDLECCLQPYARGGFGTIYRGMLQNGLQVAIKCIESHDNDEFPEQSKDLKEWYQRAAREIYMWSRCSHQGVLPMLGFIRLKGQIALITPWMESGSLQRHIGRGLLTTPLCTCIQLASVVEYLHATGIVHGDIKPDNVLMSDQGQIQLADFGSALSTLSMALDFTQTQSCNFTLRFAAPEVLKEEGCVLTKASDIYALGMTILNVMSGQPPFADKKDSLVVIAVVVNKAKPPRPDFNTLQGDIIKAKMWNILQGCLAYSPSDRPNASEVKASLSELSRLNDEAGGGNGDY